MKKRPTVSEDRPALSPAWTEALRLFDADLLRRGAAARTRRAYGFDCAQFALWCTTNGHEPTDVTTRILRRYAAALALPHAARARPDGGQPGRPRPRAQAAVQAATRPEGRRGGRPFGPDPA